MVRAAWSSTSLRDSNSVFVVYAAASAAGMFHFFLGIAKATSPIEQHLKRVHSMEAFLRVSWALPLRGDAVLCCAVLCCAVLCCAVLCCAVLCCAVLCCATMTRVCSTYLAISLSLSPSLTRSSVQTVDMKAFSAQSTLATVLNNGGEHSAALQDGRLSKAEFIVAHRAVTGKDVTAEEVDLLYEVFDLDHDGFLSFEEVISAVSGRDNVQESRAVTALRKMTSV